jgi:hypothetical protein
VSQIDADIRVAAQDADAFWAPVEAAADQIALTAYGIDFALRVSPTERNQRAAARARQGLAAIIRDQYCPAKKAFLRQAGLADFQRRAVDHCKRFAPTAAGLGGVSVTLTPQCQGAFATPCP